MRLTIIGNISEIPVKLIRKQSKREKIGLFSKGQIYIKPIGLGEYVGIEIDGNHRFCLNDFTVTHNCLNPRGKSGEIISGNKEVTSIIQAMNLKIDTDYTDEKNYKTLSYGRIIILTDADKDGFHISGLLINLFHYLFPSLLLRNPSFLTAMRTPIIRIYYPLTKKKESKKTVEFYTIKDFEKYNKETKNKNGEIKYFKGLGTNTKEEAIEIFGKKMIEFEVEENTDENIKKVFDPKQSDNRKKWIEEYDPQGFEEIVSVDQYQKLSISDYLNNEMILYSIDNCRRALPNVVDGLKESVRKIFYATELKNLKYSGKTIKVAQLAGFVAEKTSYHHGENCLLETITKMAQDFVGSNNIPLLYRGGQFGTKVEQGKDAASGRYIFTKFDKYTRLIYKPEDDDLLTHIIEENEKIEPEFYVPIIPVILVNGCSAIATGFSCDIPCYNPKDILECVRAWIQTDSYVGSTNTSNEKDEKTEIKFSVFPEIIPWYNGFLGTITKNGKNRFTTTGILSKNGKKAIVTEIPIGMATSKFKDHLDDLLEAKSIKSYKNYSTDTIVRFEIEESEDFELNIKSLKLTTSLSTNNMVLFNEKGVIKKYQDVDEILEDFCRVRYDYYIRRRVCLIDKLLYEIKIHKNKIKFLKDVMSGELDIKNVDEDKLLTNMIKMKYDPIDSNLNTEEDTKNPLKQYQYLIGMNIRSFTLQKMNILEGELDKLNREYQKILNYSERQMWIDDLKDFETQYYV